MAEIDLKVVNDGAKEAAVTVKKAEERFSAQINAVAARISEGGVRVVLLAGPSASGKTTTANLIADAVRRFGHEVLVVSLDDFYRSGHDEDYPRRPDGEKDFECPEALNLAEIRETIAAIADGKEFALPKFDFRLGARASLTVHPAMGDGCVIVEGLHALNPKIASAVEGKKALKIFVSLSTNIVADGKRLLSGKKLRFARRVVRDSIFRASDAVRTYSLWQGVLEGEQKYLYPYRNTADLYIDTFHLFEPGVMKPKALPLLYGSVIENEPYIRAVIRALSEVEEIEDSIVPEDSLIREFISGGIYEHLY